MTYSVLKVSDARSVLSSVGEQNFRKMLKQNHVSNFRICFFSLVVALNLTQTFFWRVIVKPLSFFFDWAGST